MLKGILIGIGMILPGVSGGVIAVILGVYDKIIYSLSNFFSDYKKNARFLIPLFIGMGIGAIISAKILIYIFNKYNKIAIYDKILQKICCIIRNRKFS